MMQENEVFEVRIRDVYNYLFSYGGQSQFFRELSVNRRFTGSRCPKCDFVWCPPRTTCSKCLSPTEFAELGDEGEIITTLTLAIPPPALKYLKSSLSVALVKLDGSNTCFKTIVIPKGGKLQKGMRVKAKLRKKIETLTDFYFAPI